MRLTLAVLIALVINGLLVMAMQALIVPKNKTSTALAQATVVEFVRAKTQDEPLPTRKSVRPPPKPQFQEPDPIPSNPQRFDMAELKPVPMPTPKIDIEVPFDFGKGPYLAGTLIDTLHSGSDITLANELTPVVQIPPQYPLHAKRRHIQGFVNIEFTVDKHGKVKDPKIIKAEPPAIFNKAVHRAIRFWKFEPRMKEGTPVEVRVRQRIDFSLAGR